jgi:hypothetical protein
MDDLNSRLEINKYKKFKKVDGAAYHKVNQFLRKRTYITAREWALARLCTDFRTSGGAEMTFIGQHLPELVPFMEDTYSPQAVNQARNAFKKKVRKSSATFFYGAMCGFFTTDELDDLLFEASEVARFLLEVEGTTLDIDEEIDIEDRITKVMRRVGEAAKTLLKNRSEEELVRDRPKRTDLSAIVSGRVTSPEKFPEAPGDTLTPDHQITPVVSDPEQPALIARTAAGPTREVENPDDLPAGSDGQVSPDTREIPGQNTLDHTGNDTPGNDTEDRSSRHDPGIPEEEA